MPLDGVLLCNIRKKHLLIFFRKITANGIEISWSHCIQDFFFIITFQNYPTLVWKRQLHNHAIQAMRRIT